MSPGRALLGVCSLLLALGPSLAQLGETSGLVQVMSRDLGLPGVAGTREVYLRNSTAAFVNGRYTVYKLSGPGLDSLRTGTKVTVRGMKMASVTDGITPDGSPTLELLRVFGVTVDEEPSYSDRQVTVVASSSSGSGSGSTGGGPGGRGRRSRRRLHQTGGGGSANGALPTVQVSVAVASVSTLVLPLSLEGCPKPGGGTYGAPWYLQADVEALVFEPNSSTPSASWGTASRTLGGLYRTCSHNQSTLTRANSRVAPVLRLPCKSSSSWGTPFSSTTCEYGDFVGWAEAAADILAGQGINSNDYLYKAVMLPPGTACSFIGLGYVGCDFTYPCMTWVQGSLVMGDGRGAPQGPMLLFHEQGHNFFLHHAAATRPDGSIDEYSDMSCPMGYFGEPRCMNTPHAWQLGWVAPQQLDHTSLVPGGSRKVTLKAQTRERTSGLRVNVTWVAGQAPLYISYRLAEGPDRELDPEFVNRVSLHSYASLTNNSPQFSYLLGTLAAGSLNYTHNASGLVFRVLSASPSTGNAVVWVCRKRGSGAETHATCAAGLDGDCDGLVGMADPDCRPFLAAASAPRAMPPPPPACTLGNRFCTAIAKFAKQASAAVNYYVESSSTGQLVGECRTNRISGKSACASSSVPCGCTAAGSVQGSGVFVPADKAASVAAVRCEKGHATCAAKQAGSQCQYWLATPTKLPTCSGSGIRCNCAVALAVPAAAS